ncbi:MAG: PocR ligand-binding domain-containing protein [Desulfuromonadales bacterium]|nr:PocR ligand-binding domain-containing protein [Desulfuromonadales bacterium]
MTEYTFNQLVNIDQLRNLLESQHALTGMTYAILDINENILVAVGWQDICVRFHRANPVSCASCRESDTYIKMHLSDIEGDFVEYRCKNGMIDVAMPIIIEREHVATFFSGQFFYEDDRPATDFFSTQAEEFGFDQKEYLKALERVPVFSREFVRNNMLFLCDMVKVLVRIELGNFKLEREVAERKRTEKMLIAREQDYRTLAENTGDFILRYDRQGRRTYVNPAVERFFGKTAESILGKTPNELVLFDFANNSEHMRCIRDVLTSGRAMESELLLRAPDGPVHHFLCNYAPERGHNGNVESVLSTSKDITERKRAEAALKESEFFFKESQRSASIGSYKTDFITGYWESSEVLDTIFGIDKDYIRDVQGWLDIVHPDDRDMMDRYLREEVISKRKHFSKEYRIIRKNDRKTRWVNGLGQAKFDDNGNITSLFGTIQDITEHKLIELELQRNERRMSSLYELSQYPFFNETDFLDHALDKIISLTESRIGYQAFEKQLEKKANLW